MTNTTLMPEKLLFQRDNASNPSTGKRTGMLFTGLTDARALTANVVLVVTVPTGDFKKLIAWFTYTSGGNVWVLPAASPVLAQPTGVELLGSQVLNPEAKTVYPNQTLQFLTSTAGVQVGIEYYVAI